MTVTTAYSALTFNCNGSATAFSITWPFFLSSDLVVTHITSAGVETALVLTTDYTITGGRDSTTGLPAVGTLTTVATYAAGVTLRVERATPRTQSTSFTTSGAFPAKTVEAAFDRVHMIAEEGTGGGQDGVTGDVMQLNSSGAQDYWDGEGSPVRLPFVEFSEASAPDTPSSGYGRLYVKTDGSLNFKDDAGTETDLTTAANDAAASAAAAASSASAASTSASTASAAAAAAVAVADAFDDVYLGAKIADPALDNDGDALVAGQIYYNTDTNELKVYNGADWDVASPYPIVSVAGKVGVVTLDTTDITGLTAALAAKAASADLASTSDSAKGAALIGYKPSTATTVGRLLSNVLDDVLTVKDFGAIGDNSTDDITAIEAAYTSSVSSGLPIVFPAGTYVISDTWTISNGNIKVVALGDVTIRHAGSGIAVAIDGGAAESANIFDIEFGKNSPINIRGNASTTYGLHIRGAHHLDVDVDVRECVYPCYINFTVLSRIAVRCSVFDGAFTTQPTTVLYVDKRSAAETSSANEFWCIAEGSASYGIDVVACTMSRFGGTAEGNDSGGARIRTGSYRNTFSDMDNEDNGTSADWFVEGDDNVFENCLAAISATSLSVTGDRNRFIGGFYDNALVDASASYTVFEDAEITSLTDSSATTRVIRCHTGATQLASKEPLPPKNVIAGVSTGTVAATETRFITAGVLSADFYQACGVFPFAAVITKIQVYTQAAPGSGQTQTATLYIDNTATALVATISGAGSNSASATGTVSIAAGARFAIAMVCSASAASTGPIAFGIEYKVTTY